MRTTTARVLLFLCLAGVFFDAITTWASIDGGYATEGNAEVGGFMRTIGLVPALVLFALVLAVLIGACCAVVDRTAARATDRPADAERRRLAHTVAIVMVAGVGITRWIVVGGNLVYYLHGRGGL